MQTFLYPCYRYALAPERLAGIAAYAVGRHSERFFIRRSFEPFSFQRVDPSLDLLASPPDDVVDGTNTDEAATGWRRVPLA